MRRPWLLLLGILLTAGVLMEAPFGRRAVQHEKQKSERRILCYRDPMHPWYTSNRPGRAPDCGMPLEPVYADSPASSVSTPGSVAVSSVQQRLIGVESTVVKDEVREESFRTLGRVAVEENRTYSVSTGSDGWVREVYDASTGAFVGKDTPLARLFSRDLLTPQQSYLYALESVDPRDSGHSRDTRPEQVAQFQLKQSGDALGDLGLTPRQIEGVKRTRKITSEFVVRSPISGFVLRRNAFPGQRFSKGSELYRIADLRQVWILADISNQEARLIHQSEEAVILIDGKETGVARITQILPQFDPAARTLRVRLEAENSAFTLRPDMFVDVFFRVALPPSISVPIDAVIDSGLRKIVYVEKGSGSFTPRIVQTGWRLNNRVQITDGLQPGDRIVTSGNFLIDSESRMKANGND